MSKEIIIDQIHSLEWPQNQINLHNIIKWIIIDMILRLGWFQKKVKNWKKINSIYFTITIIILIRDERYLNNPNSNSDYIYVRNDNESENKYRNDPAIKKMNISQAEKLIKYRSTEDMNDIYSPNNKDRE